MSIPPSLQKIRLKFNPMAWFWAAVDWWSQHQRYWWLAVAMVTLTWLGYDVGRVVTRADLVRMGGASVGVLTLDQATERAESMGGGRLLVTSTQNARFVDANGQAWDIPSFGSQVSREAIDALRQAKVSFDGGVSIELTPVKTSPQDVVMSIVADLMVKLGIIGLYVLIAYLVLRYFSSSSKGRFRAISQSEKPELGIADVAGHEGVKREVLEIVDYLRDPQRYARVGARPPRGVLMYGPPGNGKTLIARAIAGEAKAHFLEQSGSSFVQIYAGEGARAVRRLFEEARKNLPCVIFIDEIDAIGASRAAGGHDERIQSLNALLTEMDGFTQSDGIVVIAATNRLEVLDEALVRPGRFDRKVHVPLPSRNDRLEILRVHAARLPALTAKLERWADQTGGFSGAQLAALVNEAAVEAARAQVPEVSDREFALARDRVLLGVRDTSRTPSERERTFVAYHELGHALMRLKLGGQVEKVSILPRGQALGVTVATLEEDTRLHTEAEVQREIAILMGGRAAEEVFCGTITTGASDDLARASALARQALLRYGFNGHGPYVPEGEGLLREMEQSAREWVNAAYAQAVAAMRAHEQEVKQLAQALLAQEELSGVELKEGFDFTAPPLLATPTP